MQRRSFILLPLALVFEGKGIRVRAETPGGVSLTGSSSLLIRGEDIAVEGLHFRDGAAPRAVITIEGTRCQVSQCAIVNFNGREKEFDHN